jgi:two-component system LytT family response regulator
LPTIKTILVDDEPRGLKSLQKLLQFHCPAVEVISCCSSATEAKNEIFELHPDLVFLDIAMPGKTGLDMLTELPEVNFEVIFVTAYSDYMAQAFHFSAVDYLIKPVDEDLLTQAVSRVEKKMERIESDYVKGNKEPLETFLYNMHHASENQKKLCIPSISGFQVIEITDIIYCEASTNYTNFYFTNRPPICTSKQIHEYEQLLSDCNFIRTHKSFLVNMQHIKEYVRGEGGSLILSNGSEVEVSRRKKDWLMTKMKSFYKF